MNILLHPAFKFITLSIWTCNLPVVFVDSGVKKTCMLYATYNKCCMLYFVICLYRFIVIMFWRRTKNYSRPIWKLLEDINSGTNNSTNNDNNLHYNKLLDVFSLINLFRVLVRLKRVFRKFNLLIINYDDVYDMKIYIWQTVLTVY